MEIQISLSISSTFSIGPVKHIFSVKLRLFSYPSVYTCVFGAQKNRLIKTVLLSTHNIGFGWEIRKISFCYALLSGGLLIRIFAVHVKNSLIRLWGCIGWSESPLGAHSVMSNHASYCISVHWHAVKSQIIQLHPSTYHQGHPCFMRLSIIRKRIAQHFLKYIIHHPNSIVTNRIKNMGSNLKTCKNLQNSYVFKSKW